MFLQELTNHDNIIRRAAWLGTAARAALPRVATERPLLKLRAAQVAECDEGGKRPGHLPGV